MNTLATTDMSHAIYLQLVLQSLSTTHCPGPIKRYLRKAHLATSTVIDFKHTMSNKVTILYI